jgi:hypothetical protein
MTATRDDAHRGSRAVPRPFGRTVIELIRRAATLGVVVLALCAITFGVVRSTASATITAQEERVPRHRAPIVGSAVSAIPAAPAPPIGRPLRRRDWSNADLSRAPADIAQALAIVIIAAVVGRKVLRLRL